MTSSLSSHIRLIFFGVLLGLVGGEICIRVFSLAREYRNIQWYQPLAPVFDGSDGRYIAHPYSAYAYRPMHYSYISEQSGNEEENFINSEGFRNKEEFSENHPGVLRVLCLGSSTTYGVRNEYSHSYPSALKAFLEASLHTSVEVINAGLISATTAEDIARLPQKVIRFNPDVVILYVGFNDLVPRIFNNFKSDYSHFRISPKSSVPSVLAPFINASALMRFIHEKVIGQSNLHDYIINKENLPDSLEEKHANFVKNNTATFEYNLRYILTTLNAFHISVILPTFAFTPDKFDGWIKYFPDDLWKEGIEQNNNIIKKLQKEFKLPQVDIYEQFSKMPEAFLGKIHFTDSGNEILAHRLGEEVLQLQAVRSIKKM